MKKGKAPKRFPVSRWANQQHLRFLHIQNRKPLSRVESGAKPLGGIENGRFPPDPPLNLLVQITRLHTGRLWLQRLA